MPFPAGLTGIFVSAALLAGLAAGEARAQQAEQPCSGTLCDLYYSSHPVPPAQQTAPQPAGVPPGATPLTVPNGGFFSHMFGGGGSTPATPGTAAQATPALPPPPSEEPAAASNGYMTMNGGGVLNTFMGGPSQRCSGTLCDTYYGSAPPEPAAAAAAQQAAPAPHPSGVSYDEAPRPVRKKRVTEQDTRPRCASAGHDAWSCLR